MEYKLREYQKKASDAAYNFFMDKKANYNAIEVLPTGCHARGSSIIMADGSLSLVENVRIGDYLLGDDGSPRKVLDLHSGVDKMYMITPIKGNPFSVNGGHILSLYKTNEGGNYLSCKPRIDEITVMDYLNTSNNYKHLHKLRRASFINFKTSEKLSLSPYFLGLYLGDGNSSNGSVNITTMRQEVKEFIYSFAESISMRVTDQFKGVKNKAHTYNIVYKKAKRNILQKELDSLGLLRITCAFKFIPQKYKTASREDRLQLLAGLLDTDSYFAVSSNSFEYCSKSKRLVDDIVFVCRSLGFFAQIGVPKIVNGETYYRIQITGDLNIIPTKVGIRKGRKRKQKKSPLVTGFSVKYLGQGDYYGFTLDGNHLYCDYQFFIHHNSGKSLVLSDIASRLNGPVLVFQPSKEILAQNFEKYMSYDPFDCGIYSASMNQKDISKVTFATIGSAIGHKELFQQFKYIIVDECFPYKQFISTERGKMKIGYLYKLFQDGKELPKVLSYDVNKEILLPNKIISVRNNGIKDVFKFKFNESFTFKSTENHPVLTESGWKPIGNLDTGEVVFSAYPNRPHLKIPNQDQIEFLLGSLVGDGSIDRSRKTINANRFRFIQGERQEAYLKWKASLLCCSEKIQRIEHNGFAGKPAYRFTSEVLYIKDCICTKSYAINNLSLKSLAIIYMDDGHLDHLQNQATICSVAESEELTLLFVSKLKHLGIDCVACKSNSSLTNKEYNYVRIRSNGVKVLCRLISPYIHPSMKYKIIDEYVGIVGSYKWNSDFNKLGCSIFLSKEYLGKKEVYNMEVENAHNYIITSARYDKNHKNFDNGLIVHNCHGVNPQKGMYKDFFESLGKTKILGLTATPYRLTSYSMGSILKFITRTRPAIFKKVIFNVQISTLLDMGYLANLNYYNMNPSGWNEQNLKINSTGADYTDKSVVREYERIDFYSYLVQIVRRLMNPKQGGKRKGILVFTRFIKESERLVNEIPNSAIVTGDTPKKERERILSDFKSGKIKVVANAQVLTTGFDYPELDTIVLARPTMSLALYYQMVGRGIRPFENKTGWIVDLCGNIKRFGEVSDLKLLDSGNGRWAVYSNERQLTNVFF